MEVFSNLSPYITVDECLVAFRSRNPFPPYMPNKSAKFAECKMKPCKSRKQIYTRKNLQVILPILKTKQKKPLGHKGHPDFDFWIMGSHYDFLILWQFHVTIGEELLGRKVNDFLKENKPELPKELTGMETRNVTLPVFALMDTMHPCPTAPRKTILLISTMQKIATEWHTRQKKISDQSWSLYAKSLWSHIATDKILAPWCFFSIITAFLIWFEILSDQISGKMNWRISLEQLVQARGVLCG